MLIITLFLFLSHVTFFVIECVADTGQLTVVIRLVLHIPKKWPEEGSPNDWRTPNDCWRKASLTLGLRSSTSSSKETKTLSTVSFMAPVTTTLSTVTTLSLSVWTLLHQTTAAVVCWNLTVRAPDSPDVLQPLQLPIDINGQVLTVAADPPDVASSSASTPSDVGNDHLLLLTHGINANWRRGSKYWPPGGLAYPHGSSNSSSELEARDKHALLYIVVVLLFYSTGIVVAIVMYLKREKAEIEEEKAYDDYARWVKDLGVRQHANSRVSMFVRHNMIHEWIVTISKTRRSIVCIFQST